MYTNLRFLLLFFFIACFSASNGQTPWSLQQCIDRADAYNIQIKLSELSTENSKVTVDQNVASLFPSLNASASQNYFFGRSIDPYTNTFTTQQVRNNSFSLSSSVSLFEGFQLQNNLKQSRLSYLSAQNDLKKVKNDISLNVVTYYLQVLYNQELLDITNHQVAVSDTQRYRMKRMYELGAASKGNYLELESQYAQEQVRFVQAKAQVDQSVLSLTQLLELDTVKDFTIVRPDVIVPTFNAQLVNVDAVYNIALTTQPEIKSSEYKVYSSEKGLASARGGRSPRLFVSGSLSTNYSTSSQEIIGYDVLPPSSRFSGYTSSGDSVFSLIPNSTPLVSKTPFSDQFSNNLGKSVGITLQLPLINGWAVHSNIKRAKINVEQSKLNLEQSKKTLYKSVQQAVADAMASYNKYDAGQRSVDALQETFKYNKQRFAEGLINAYDYLLAKNNFDKAQADLIQAKYDYIFRLKILDFYQGKPLSF